MMRTRETISFPCFFDVVFGQKQRYIPVMVHLMPATSEDSTIISNLLKNIKNDIILAKQDEGKYVAKT